MREILDGIINPQEFYEESNIKILWILKEGNVSIEDYNKPRDLCEELRNGEHKKNALSIATFRKIIYSSYWLLNNDLNWEDIPFANEDECYNILNKIAYININKYPAGSKSYDSKLYKIYEENKIDLLNQIKKIDPEIIIFGNTFKFFKNDLKTINWKIDFNEQYSYENNNYYIIPNKGLCISAYHPAYPKLSDYNYSNEIKEISKKYINTKL
ncbi:hypothetical protein SAMN05421738_10154 [Algoriella xinjiangensis]|uniref:Uracil DNA glycosylase superfamily protein n=1 Tax=Algoriella xinjiangensis TaxID=684065 RepID=A0A1I4S5I3_9FLAO|nr:hypothetical protein [Algoriella xinjiangensis]SFM59533.1 hypothetical protein SAMN05421738_10154 [Algoriella xinjiangensis]VDH15902.1 Uncharacterised protein [Algoriella xinjiangensis]